MALSNAVARHGKLRVVGNRIVDKTGKPVALHGMSLFWSQWMPQYYNADTINWLVKDWRCDIVRAAMAVDNDGYLKNPAAEKKRIVAVVDAAIKAGIYVLIDWHDHEAHKHTKESVQFFGEMAKRYAGVPNVIYETFNEPLEKADWKTEIKPYHETVIKEIRRHAPDSLVVCGTRMWSQRVDEAASDPIRLPNIAYTLHFYAATHKQYLRDIAATALKNGIALMVTEYGTTEASGDGVIDFEETKKWWTFLDANKISSCNWSIADKVENAAALKPGSSGRGGWSDALLTRSGTFVRAELRRQNPAPPTPKKG